MIFPFILLMADICLWWLVQQVALLDQPLLTTAVFGLAFGLLIWVIFETQSLIRSDTDTRSEDD